MEHLNKVELQGTLWTVTIQKCGDTLCAKLCLYTDYCYTAKDGSAVIETCWHHVTVWEGENIKDLTQLTSGALIHIIGRLRIRTRKKATGEPVTVHDIVAHTVEIIQPN